MTTMKKRTGRPSRGPRDPFTVKVSETDGKKLRQLAEVRDMTYQDLLEMLISDSLSRIDVESENGQEALPIGRLAS